MKKFAILVCFIFTGTAYADLNEGLIAHYPFNGNIEDISGNENHGIAYGTTIIEALIEDRFFNPNSAFRFDGIDDYIQVPDSDSLDITTDKITISVWINLVEFFGSGQHYIFDSRDGQGGGYGMNIDTNRLQFWIGDKYPTFLINIPSRKWHHIIGTYDGKIMNLYINGILTNSTYFTANFVHSMTPLYIGQYWQYTQRFYGDMDDLRIYDRILSELEIIELYEEDESDEPEEPEEENPDIIKIERVSSGGCFTETIK